MLRFASRDNLIQFMAAGYTMGKLDIQPDGPHPEQNFMRCLQQPLPAPEIVQILNAVGYTIVGSITQIIEEQAMELLDLMWRIGKSKSISRTMQLKAAVVKFLTSDIQATRPVPPAIIDHWSSLFSRGH